MTKYKSEAELFDSIMAAEIAEHMNLDLSDDRKYGTSKVNDYSAYVVVISADRTERWYLD